MGVGPPARSAAVCGRVCLRGCSVAAPRSSLLSQAPRSPVVREAPGEVWLTGPSRPVGGLGGGAGGSALLLGAPLREEKTPGAAEEKFLLGTAGSALPRTPSGLARLPCCGARTASATQAAGQPRPRGRRDSPGARSHWLSTRGPWAPTRQAPRHSPRQLCVLCSLAGNDSPKRCGQGLSQSARARPGDVLRSQLPINYGWKQIRKSQFCMSRFFSGQRRPVAGSSGRQGELNIQVGKLPALAAVTVCRN